MGFFSKETLSYICAALNMVGSLLGVCFSITFCVWYKDESRTLKNLESGLTDTPFWIYVVLSISFVFTFLSTISLIRGIKLENKKMIAGFLTASYWVVLILFIRAFVLVSRHNKANHSSASVAGDFFKDIAYAIFIMITSIPFYVWYSNDCSCRSERKHSSVPHSEV